MSRIITTLQEIIEAHQRPFLRSRHRKISAQALGTQIRIASSTSIEWNVLSIYTDKEGHLWLDIEEIK